MTDHDMTDAELDALLGRAARFDDADVARLALSPAATGLLEEIMRTPAALATPPADPPLARPGRQRLRLALVAAASVAALFIGIAVLPAGGGGSAFAAEAVRVAEANARVLVDGEGWEVTRVDEFTVNQGEMTFSDGANELDLNWRPGELYTEFVQDRSSGAQVRRVQVLGEDAQLFDDGGYATILPVRGPSFIEIRGDAMTESTYRSILDSLRAVDVETWLEALPASAVREDQSAGVVTEMLRGLPLPPGFDPTSIEVEPGVNDRYQIGARVAGYVACGWIDSWHQATQSGDTATAAAALAAMESSRNWPVLQEMDPAGFYPEGVWEIAPAMCGEVNLDPNGGTDQLPHMRSGVGCDVLGLSPPAVNY